MDGEYIKSVQKRFGRRKLKTFPNMTALDVFYYRFIKNIRVVPLLAYLKYDQKEVTERLSKELGWNYYGGHHHESYYTHFFQSYYLPKKFNIDKRKVEYSALIRSGQMTRQKALDEIQNHPYPYDEELVRYAIKKLGLTKKEFDDIMAVSNKSFRDYSTYYPFIKALKPLLAVVQKLNFFPKHLYLKFLG